MRGFFFVAAFPTAYEFIPYRMRFCPDAGRSAPAGPHALQSGFSSVAAPPTPLYSIASLECHQRLMEAARRQRRPCRIGHFPKENAPAEAGAFESEALKELELQLHGYLNLARRSGIAGWETCAGDDSERSRSGRERAARLSIVRMVE